MRIHTLQRTPSDTGLDWMSRGRLTRWDGIWQVDVGGRIHVLPDRMNRLLINRSESVEVLRELKIPHIYYVDEVSSERVRFTTNKRSQSVWLASERVSDCPDWTGFIGKRQ